MIFLLNELAVQQYSPASSQGELVVMSRHTIPKQTAI